MRRLVIIISLLAPCAILLSQHSRSSANGEAIPSATPEKVNCKPCRRPDTDKPNEAPNVTDLKLEKTEIRRPCEGAATPPKPRDLAVSVEAVAEDPEGDVLTYNYKLTGGRHIGTGKHVTWDLNKVEPGAYEITLGVDDGCGVCGRTISKSITVLDCTPNALTEIGQMREKSTL